MRQIMVRQNALSARAVNYFARDGHCRYRRFRDGEQVVAWAKAARRRL